MRTSERFAAGAVFAMTMPAFLAFPAFGIWSVVKVWPGMMWLDRSLFCSAVGVFCVGLPYSFRRGMARHAQGQPAGLTASEVALIWVPIIAGEWALTRRLDILFGAAWKLATAPWR